MFSVKHRKNNEYSKNNPLCEHTDCKECPYYTDTIENYPKRCEYHKLNDDTNVVERECKNCRLFYYLNKSFLCNDCDTFTHRNITVKKEHKVRDILKTRYKMYTSTDKIPNYSCLKYRPYFIWNYGTHIAVLEVDENQHTNVYVNRVGC